MDFEKQVHVQLHVWFHDQMIMKLSVGWYSNQYVLQLKKFNHTSMVLDQFNNYDQKRFKIKGYLHQVIFPWFYKRFKKPEGTLYMLI